VTQPHRHTYTDVTVSTHPPSPPTPPRPTRVLTWLLLLALVCSRLNGLAGLPARVFAQEGTSTAAAETGQAGDAVPEPPDISAAAAYVVDVSIDTPLYARSADERRPPASLVKMMTAIVAHEHAALDDQVVIVAADEVDDEVFSHMGLVAGDTVTVEQLLYGLLVPSGNDAANALARHVGAIIASGDAAAAAASVAAFVAAMNERAAALGMANTHFVNPAGEDVDDQYASARDLATLARVLMEDQKLSEIVASREYQTVSVGPELRPYGDAGILFNTNNLLAEPGVHGVKTGTTAAAGGNLVTATYFAGDNRVVAVVLGSPYEIDPATEQAIVDERYPDTDAIFAALVNDYRWFDPAIPGTVPGLDDEMGAWQVAMPPGPAVVVPADQIEDFRYALRLGPPGEPNSEVGKVLFFVADRPVGERPLVQT